MSDTKEFDVIRVARSDGADTGPGYWPTISTAARKTAGKEMALSEKTPRVKPQMTRLSEDDPRFVEWRIKLGILLKQELSPNPEEGNAWYVQFPRGYWLYEKSKHLWVSGYPIKAKLYKSPQEFGIHLIWLLSASKDYKDCCCVHCNLPIPGKLASSIDELIITPSIITPSETSIPAPTSGSTPMTKSASNTPTPVSGAAMPQKVTPVPLPPMFGQRATPPVTAAVPVAKSPTPKLTNTPMPQLQPQPQPQSQPQPQPPQQQQPPIQPQPQPQAQRPAQQSQPVRWSLQGSLLFRTGELTWYQNGNTWRLGVVSAITSNTNHNQLNMLPIGHALVPQQPVSKTNADLRPFHAFSVPPVAVQDLKDKSFDQVPWDALFHSTANDPSKRELLALDASKLAASRIDASYSLWCPLHEDHPNVDPCPYYGCFFGAERIEIGDCLRIKPVPSEPALTQDSLVMGLRYIFTRKEYPGAVFFRGNVYQFTKSESTPFVPEEQLPIALRDETIWRKQVNPSKPWRWILVKENATLNEKFVKGRFYPAHRLMPILDPDAFNAALAQGRVDDQIPYLNNRMDGSAGGYNGRRLNRLESLGMAVPPGSRIALEPLIREEGTKVR